MGKVVKIFLNQGFTPIDNSLFRRGTLLDFDCYIQRFNGFAILIESGTFIDDDIYQKLIKRDLQIYVENKNYDLYKKYREESLSKTYHLEENETMSFEDAVKNCINIYQIVSRAKSINEKLKAIYMSAKYLFDAWIKNGDRTLSGQGGNVNLLQDILNPQQLWVFDHNLALNPDEDLAKLATHHVFCGENAGVSLDDMVTKAEYETRIQRCMELLPHIIATIPESWIEEANSSRRDGKEVINDVISPILRKYNDPDFWSWITP